MLKKKYVNLAAIATTAFVVSGCVPATDPFYNSGYYNTSPRVAVGLYSYSYPYYFDRPYYFLDGLYYYGGYYRNGYYYYGNRIFRHGHYYYRGNRYYNGRRYVARSGTYGYYRNRSEYQRAVHHRGTRTTRQRSLNNGRIYQRNQDTQRVRTNTYTQTKRTRESVRRRKVTDTARSQTREYRRDRYMDRRATRTRTNGWTRGENSTRERKRAVR